MTGTVVVGPESPDHPYHGLWVQGKTIASELASLGEGVDFAVPRVHGNGFVQIDLDRGGGRRVHIWGHPAVPAQKTWTGIHDHVYTVASEVIVGRIIDISWKVRSCDAPTASSFATHSVYQAQPQLRDPAEQPLDGEPPRSYDTVLVNSGRRVSAKVHKTLSYGDGCHESTYMVPAGAYHSSVEDGVAATVMTKVTPAFHQPYPRVLVPFGRSPDNAFSRHSHNKTLLLGVIGEVVPDWLDLLGS